MRAWLILQKLRRAMAAPQREALRGEVEVDLIGGHHEGRCGGRRRDGNKTLVGVIVEVCGQGSGRLRLRVLPDASQDTLTPLGEGEHRARRDRPHRRLARLRQAHRRRL